jgi:outer membrane protein assembly factor BamB
MRSMAYFIIILAITATSAEGWQTANPGRSDSSEPRAVSTSPLALPFKRSWQYLTDSASSLPPTIDGDRIYLPLAGGRVVCLDRETGSLNWTSEPGGSITSSIVTGEKGLYIAVRKLGQDGADAGASLKAVDKQTGLTLWSHDYGRAFTSPLVISEGRIYAGSADGSFYALSAESGDLIWKVATQDVVRGRALVNGQVIYFGSDDGAVRAVEISGGGVLWRFQTGGKVTGRPATDDRTLYFGSGDGYLYAVDLATRKLKWRARTGAAIEASIVIDGDRVLAASFDNFIYSLDRQSGNRLWKRRMDNRIAAEPIVVGDAMMIAPLRAGYLAVFLNSDGRSLNFFQMDRGVEIVADAVFSGDTLAIATDRGLVVAKMGQQSEDQRNARSKPGKRNRLR